VHVYFEHREQGHDVGASSFLYPFLGRSEQPLAKVVEDVQKSMLHKVAEVNGLRAATAESQVAAIEMTAEAIAERLESGGALICFGNGGSATDANDLTIDCVAPPVRPGKAALEPIPAISLATEPASITAIANDIGAEAIFTRQIIAHARPVDVAIGISTSGSSLNILAAFHEARKRGMLTVGLAGYDGGKMVAEGLVDHALVAPSDYIPRIQEVQASMYHVLRERIGERYRGRA
jgi:D-sedoheptulose 7-phosphate isomerase